LNIADDSWAES